MIRRPPRSTPFPDTTLFRSVRIAVMRGTIHLLTADDALVLPALCEPILRGALQGAGAYGPALRDVDLVRLADAARTLVDRKSTRLNSSHANISYAVFCLKKK